MLKKVLRLVVVLSLCAAVLLFTPGLLELITNGVQDEPLDLGDSTLTKTEILFEDTDPTWIAPTANYVNLKNDKIEFDGLGATLSDDRRTLTVTREGTYVINGTIDDGQILVDVLRGDVHIVLNGADMHCSWSSPIYIKQAGEIRISLEAGTENRLSDSKNTITDIYGAPSAVIYSADDLVLCGTGSLTVDANYREGIHCTNRLAISDVTLDVTAPEDGIVGHDALLVQNATVTVDSGMDCLKSNNYEAGLGYVYIKSGIYDLTSENDAIQAEQRLLIEGGDFHIEAGDGYTYVPDSLISQKGIKVGAELVIRGGSFFINTTDDAIHCDGLLSVAGGELNLYTGDDALSGKEVAIRGGQTRASASVQGLVGELIRISGGALSLTAQDDGILARPANQPTDDGFNLYPDSVGGDVYVELSISGGITAVHSSGDSLDVRGELKMSGGFVMLNAPFLKGGDPLDYDGTFTMTGGTLVTTGRATYKPVMPEGGNACILDAAFTGVRPAGEMLSLRLGDGRLLFAVTPTEDYYNFAVYSCEFGVGSVCSLLAGGTPMGEEVFGIALGGEIGGAVTLSTFSVNAQTVELVSRAEAPIPDEFPENPIL